jgi:hypothetical protein
LRYEEVALAFDEEPPEDGPTFEAHALPSNPAILAALPLANEEPETTPPTGAEVGASPPLPPVSATHEIARPSNVDSTIPPRSAPRPRAPGWLVMVALVGTVAFLGLLALAVTQLALAR